MTDINNFPQNDLSPNDLSKLAGQLIMIRFPGTELDAATAGFIKANGIRAVCLFRGNMTDAAQLSKLTADLRAVMGPESLIAIDQEGGAVVRATWVPAPPSAMGLGAADDAGLAQRTGAAVARAIKSLGFNWNFAPVLDLNNNPYNPVIAERSFGDDPQRAAELALAWMAGSQSEGVACCARLYMPSSAALFLPQASLPTVAKSRSQLEEYDFVPFRQATAQAASMMSAHVLYPALDAALPASLSPRVLQDLVRGQWHYDGVIISDGLDTACVRERHMTGELALRSVTAGSDMAMVLERPAAAAALDALAGALAAGRLPLQAVGTRLARLATQARRYPAKAEGNAQHYVQEAADRIILAEGWRRCKAALARQP